MGSLAGARPIAPAAIATDDLVKQNQAQYYGLQAAMAALDRQVSESSVPNAGPRPRIRTAARLPGRAWRGLRGAIPWRRPDAVRCRASGWRLHVGCADHAGRAICPVCSREVDTGPGVIAGRPVRVIRRHACSAPASGRRRR